MSSSFAKRVFGEEFSSPMVGREALAGLTTFLTMSYIIFVQPDVLSGQMFGFATGMDFGAIMFATCIAAAVSSVIMGLLANYPIALAPGMGENFFFVFTVIPACAALPLSGHEPWQTALGVVLISGVLFLLLSLLGLRQAIMDAMSPSMKNSVAVGIGLFIAFIGLQNSGIIVDNPGTLVALRHDMVNAESLIFIVGLVVTAVLFVRRVRGAVFIGILTGACMAVILGKAHLAFPVGRPPSIAPTLFQLDLGNVFRHFLALLPFIIIFTVMDIFDTVGTLVGVAEQADLMVDNKLPRAQKALVADATGTVLGSFMGTSTVTSYIESTTGVETGGRTGLTACFVALFFILALFLSPLVGMVTECKAVTAPALIVVGAMMMRNAKFIEWDNYSECIPAFLTMIGIPLTYSIADGLALGFISYPLVKLFGGKTRETSWLMYLLGATLLLYFIFVRARIA
jgi:AGZA family xanthine/uracil permease-like MFS transporter